MTSRSHTLFPCPMHLAKAFEASQHHKFHQKTHNNKETTILFVSLSKVKRRCKSGDCYLRCFAVLSPAPKPPRLLAAREAKSSLLGRLFLSVSMTLFPLAHALRLHMLQKHLVRRKDPGLQVRRAGRFLTKKKRWPISSYFGSSDGALSLCKV